MCVQRLKKRHKQVANVLKAYTAYAWDIFNNAPTPLSHLIDHPEEVRKYLAENPGKTHVDLGNMVVMNHFAMLSASDEKLREYNRAANIIDAMFHGDNPFREHYGNKSLFPALSIHSRKYFYEDTPGPIVAGFEEQFCDYLVLRVYGDEMSDTVNKLRNFIGDEWFLMMDGFYAKVVDRISEKGKVYQYKND